MTKEEAQEGLDQCYLQTMLLEREVKDNICWQEALRSRYKMIMEFEIPQNNKRIQKFGKVLKKFDKQERFETLHPNNWWLKVKKFIRGEV